MTYDPGLNGVVLFGGLESSGYLNDTWLFSGGHWKELVTSSSPSPRSGSMVTFDSSLGRLLLYGGLNSSGIGTLGDLWALNGSSWTLVNLTNAPGDLADGIFVYDPSLSGDILFGGIENDARTGYSDVVSDYTWLYRNGSWTNLSPIAGPPPPSAEGFSGDFDPLAGGVVIFGGGTASGYVNSTWLFSNQTWARMDTGIAPAARWFGEMASDAGDNESLLFGGEGGSGGAQVYFDTWAYKSGNWTEVNTSGSPAPAGAVQASIASLPSPGGVLLFGGSTGSNYINATWEFSAGSWAETNLPVEPVAADSYQLASDPGSNRTILFGPLYGSSVSQTWEWINDSWTALNLSNTPPALSHPSLTFDGAVDCFVLFGGQSLIDRMGPTNSTWALCSGRWINESNQSRLSPAARWGAQLSYDAVAGVDILFGGSTGSHNFTDTWMYQNWSWVELSPPAHPGEGGWGQDMSMTYDPSTGGEVWIGTSGWDAFRSEMWVYSHGSWTNDSTTLPSDLANATGISMAYDSLDGYLLAFGGSCYQQCDGSSSFPNPISSETWALVNGTWNLLNTSSNPPPRFTAPMTGLGSAGVLLFGGANGSGLADTWEYSGGVWVELSPTILLSSAQVDAGHAVKATLRFSSLAPLSSVIPGDVLVHDCSTYANTNYTCSFSVPGTYLLTEVVVGKNSFSASATTLLIVNPLPSVESFVADPSNVTVNGTLTLRTEASGGTGPLSYMYTNLPTGCHSANSSTLTCTPSVAENMTIAVGVQDSDGASAAGMVNVSVLPIQGSPQLPNPGAPGTGARPSSAIRSIPIPEYVLFGAALGLASIVGVMARRRYVRLDATRLVAEMRETIAHEEEPPPDGS